MKTFEHKFDLFEAVQILGLEWKGRVIGIWWSETGLQYQVRYFANFKAEKEYFFEDELQKIEN